MSSLIALSRCLASARHVRFMSCRRFFRRRSEYSLPMRGCSSTLSLQQEPCQQDFMRRSQSTSSTGIKDERQDKNTLTTIRLYRILQRQCMELSSIHDDDVDQAAILIQPQLRASFYGPTNLMVPPTTTIEDLFRLFYNICDIEEEDDKEDPTNGDVENEEDVLAVIVGDREDLDELTESGKSSSSASPSPSNRIKSNRSSSSNGSIHDWYGHVSPRGQEQYPLEPEGTPVGLTFWTTGAQVRQAIRHAFRTHYSNSRRSGRNSHDSSSMDVAHLHKWAIRANQLLQQQTQLWNHSSITTTRNIRVVATSRYELISPHEVNEAFAFVLKTHPVNV